jgi:steroid delta-isomerase-like uncharacterized protein
MQTSIEQNKKAVLRFNKEFIEQGRLDSFHELVAADVINHSAPAGSSKGQDGMLYFLQDILRKGFPDMKVEIFDQVAENDRVTTRKAIHATHLGEFMGIPASNKKVVINVIDIIRLRDGKYVEHWGMSNLPEIMSQLSNN